MRTLSTRLLHTRDMLADWLSVAWKTRPATRRWTEEQLTAYATALALAMRGPDDNQPPPPKRHLHIVR